MSLYNELPIAFPWYEKLEQQNRYRENAEPYCDYKLITPADALLPFQFVRNPGERAPASTWHILEINTNTVVATMNAASRGLIRTRVLQMNTTNEYFYYSGEALKKTDGSALSLDPGYYYSQLIFPSGVVYYSEMFHVPENRFNKADDDNIDYVKLTWYNDNDLKPIFYNDKVPGPEPYFKNVYYLDTFITQSDPEVIEDGTKDGNDDVVVTFQKALIRYRATVLVPDFMKLAMVVMQMHDHVILTTKFGVRTGELRRLSIGATPDTNGAFSVVDINFEQDMAMVKKGCSDNLTNTTGDCIGAAPTLTITPSGSDYILQGVAPAGTTIQFWGYNTAMGGVFQMFGPVITAAEFLAGYTVAQTEFTDTNYILARALNFSCDFGFSPDTLKPV